MQESPFAHLMPQQSGSPPRGQVFSLPVDPTKQANAQAELRNKNLTAQEQQLRIAQMQQAAAQTNSDKALISTSAVHGPDYLKSLPPALAEQIKMISEGRLGVPASGLRSPYWQNMMQHVANYDPEFDQIDYNARLNTRKDFTSGKSAQNVKALNTAIGHVGQLASQIEGTASHGGFPLATVANSVQNAYKRTSGDPGISKFEQTAGAVASELTQVFRGSGGAEADVTRYLGELNSNASLAQKQAAIKNIAGLLNSRLQAIGDQYTKGMGKSSQPLQLLDEHAQHVMNSITADDNKPTPPGMNGAGGAPQGGGGPGGGGGVNRSTTLMLNGAIAVPQLALADGKTMDVADPVLKAKAHILSAMARNPKTSDDEIRAFAQSNWPNGTNVNDILTFRRANPGYRGGYDVNGLGTKTVPVPTQTDAFGNTHDPNQSAQSPLGTFFSHAGNSATTDNLDSLAGLGGIDPTQVRAGLALQGQKNPWSAFAGDIAGALPIAAALEGAGTFAAGRLGLGAKAAPWVTRGADGVYGAAAGAGSNDDNRLSGAIGGAITSAGGGMFGRGATRAVGNVATGVRNAAVDELTSRGIPLTVGQAVSQSGTLGKTVKGIEDVLSGVPGIGSIINARRTEGLRSFNSAALKDGIEPVKNLAEGQVSGIGEQGIDQGRQIVSGAYSKALDGVKVFPDEQFIADMQQAISKGSAIPRTGQEFQHVVNSRIAPLMNGPDGSMTGPQIQDAFQGIRGKNFSDDAMGADASAALGSVGGAIEGMVGRQAPDVLPNLASANHAYRNLNVLADATGRAANTDGIFTPAQLGLAARGNAKKFQGTLGAASENRPFFDLQRAGQNILPSKMPDSGTAGRLAVLGLPAMLGGAGGYASGDAETGGAAGLTLGALLAAGGTKWAQKILVNSFLKRPDAAVRIGNQINRLAPVGGLFGASGASSYLPSGN